MAWSETVCLAAQCACLHIFCCASVERTGCAYTGMHAAPLGTAILLPCHGHVQSIKTTMPRRHGGRGDTRPLQLSQDFSELYFTTVVVFAAATRRPRGSGIPSPPSWPPLRTQSSARTQTCSHTHREIRERGTEGREKINRRKLSDYFCFKPFCELLAENAGCQ